ncbi:unnamed protein product, partial [Prorocentrum cordatum]
PGAAAVAGAGDGGLAQAVGDDTRPLHLRHGLRLRPRVGRLPGPVANLPAGGGPGHRGQPARLQRGEHRPPRRRIPPPRLRAPGPRRRRAGGRSAGHPRRPGARAPRRAGRAGGARARRAGARARRLREPPHPARVLREA